MLFFYYILGDSNVKIVSFWGIFYVYSQILSIYFSYKYLKQFIYTLVLYQLYDFKITRVISQMVQVFSRQSPRIGGVKKTSILTPPPSPPIFDFSFPILKNSIKNPIKKNVIKILWSNDCFSLMFSMNQGCVWGNGLESVRKAFYDEEFAFRFWIFFPGVAPNLPSCTAILRPKRAAPVCEKK